MSQRQSSMDLDLREYRTERDVALSSSQILTLRRCIPTLVVSPSRTESGLFDLTPQSQVGVFESAGLSMRIWPKFDVRNLAFVLGFSRDSARAWLDTAFGFDASATISDLVVPGFIDAVERAFVQGVLRGYRTIEEARASVRGRVLFDRQVKRHFGRILPVEVRWDEFSADIEENRLIRAAVQRLRRLRLPNHRDARQLRAIEALLQDVTQVSYPATAVPSVAFHRLNERYRDAVQLSRLILENAAIEVERGDVRSRAFLVDMNKTFEDFVVRLLRRTLRVDELSFPQGCAPRKLYLDSAHTVRLLPDISWWHGETCSLIGDVKYKTADYRKHPSDLYQVEAYAIAAGLPHAYLIYATESPPEDISLARSDKAIRIRGINLSLGQDALVSQIESLAAEFRSDMKNVRAA